VLVGVAFQPSWHSTLSGEDFHGHLALLTSFFARLGEPDRLPLWTSGRSSDFVWATASSCLAALSMLPGCRSLGATALAGFLLAAPDGLSSSWAVRGKFNSP
jgi:hypothetical protein